MKRLSLILWLVALPAFSRTNPFYPEITSQDAQQQATLHPFANYDAIGYVKGNGKLLALIATPEHRILYLQPGYVLGREKYVFQGIKEGAFLTFGKSIHDMDGKEENLVQIKEITGK